MADRRPPLWWARLRLVLLALACLGLVAFVSWRPEPVRHHKHRIPVRFWHMWTAEWAAVVDKIVAEYNASQDTYEVIALSVPANGADTKFLLAVSGGNPPDVMAQWNPVIPTWAESNLLQPLDELMSPKELATFKREAYPVVQKIGAYRGRLYGITIGINLWECYYLPDQVRAAGLDPDRFPTTLEELDAWGDKLHKFDKAGNLVRLGYLPSSWQQIAPLFRGGFYDWDRQEVTVNTPENSRALEYLVGRRKKLGFENVLRFNAGLNTDSFAGGWPFIGGAYSITIDGQWRVEQIGKYAPHLNYRTAPLPAPAGGRPGAGFSNGNFMIIPKGAKSVQGAWDFIKFWSGIEKPERAARFYTMGGWLPLSPAVARAPIYQEYLRKYPQFQTFLDGLSSEYVRPLPPVPYQMYLNDRVGRAEDFAVRGSKTPKEALAELERDVKHEVRRRKELGYGE